jgi:hypothetical protein
VVGATVARLRRAGLAQGILRLGRRGRRLEGRSDQLMNIN